MQTNLGSISCLIGRNDIVVTDKTITRPSWTPAVWATAKSKRFVHGD
jgi:7-keto-8-aminopelargonate synthetase-like enzyme